MRRRTIVLGIAGIVGILGAPYLLLAGTIVWAGVSERAGRRSFEPTAWRAGIDTASARSRPLRLRMVDDLLARRLLDRRTRPEVIALLGEPPASPYFRQYDLVYYLGPERGLFSIDSEWLGIRLGTDGRVAEATLLRD